MLSVIGNCWALFLGMGLIMLGNGLQGTLLGVRASLENFGTTITGMMMSGYFLGLIFGCNFVPRMVWHVGHIRTFGALASLASTAILVQAVFVDPWIWWAMRLVTGFAYSGLYIVAESWLNDSADNSSRGQILSLYMLVSLGGMAGGQMLLNLAEPSGFQLFVLVSLLISLALIPILLSATRAPFIGAIERVGIASLYRVSPLGVVGMVIIGMAMGAILAMGAVYATDVGMSVREVSFFMTAMILGGFFFQYPLGWLSDRIGRRKVICLSCVSGALISFLAMGLTGKEAYFLLVIAAVGGFSLPLYALCGVHTNDYLTPTQMVAASGTLVLLSSIGATAGSPMAALAMEIFGPQAFYGTIGFMLSIVAGFAMWRSTRRVAVVVGEQGDFVVMASTPLAASLKPDVELEDLETAIDEDTEDILTSFDELAKDLEAAQDEAPEEDRR